MVTPIQIVIAGKDISQAAFASASRSLDGLKGKAESTKMGVGALGAVVAGAVATLQVKGSIDMLDQLDDLQEKTGISVEKLSELRFAGESVGTPFEALAGGVGRLSKLMAEAAGGNKEAAATFKALKVEVQNADGSLRSNDEVLGDLADRFSGFADGAEKSALAQRIFGKSGAEMIPFLNQGRDGIEKLRLEAAQLGAIYGGALAKDAADFNDNLTKLKLASEAAAISMSGPFLKSLVDISAQMLEARKEAGLLKAILITIGGALTRTLGIDEIGQLQKKADAANAEKNRLSGMMIGPEQQLQRDPGNEMAQRRVATYRKQIEAQMKIASDASDQLKKLANAADPNGDPMKRQEDRGFTPGPQPKKGSAPVVAGGGGGGSGGEKKAKDEEAAAKRFIESLQKQVEKVKELSEVEEALAEIQRIRAKGGVVTEEERQRMLVLAAEIDITKERTAAKKEEAKEQEEAQRRLFALQDEGKKIYESSRTPLEAYNAAVEHLNDLRSQGVISSETYTRAVKKESEEMAEAQKRLADTSDEFSKHAAENIQDAIGQGLVDTLDGNFKNIGDNFAKMMKRIVAEAIAADVSRAMFGSLVKGGEGKGLFGDLLSGIGKVLGGGGWGAAGVQTSGVSGWGSVVTQDLPVLGGRADGGAVAAGATYMVGERGYELFTPGVAGTITPNHALGRGDTYHYNFTVGDVATKSMVQQAVANSERRVVGGLGRSRDYAGRAA